MSSNQQPTIKKTEIVFMLCFIWVLCAGILHFEFHFSILTSGLFTLAVIIGTLCALGYYFRNYIKFLRSSFVSLSERTKAECDHYCQDHHLPAFQDQSLFSQISLVCETFDHTCQDLAKMSNDRFVNRLLQDESHTHVAEDLDDQLDTIMHIRLGFQWSYHVLIIARLEGYESYMLNNNMKGLQLSELRNMFEVVESAFSFSIGQCHKLHCVERGNSCVFLVNLEGSKKDSSKDEIEAIVDSIASKCQDAVLRVRENFNLNIEVSVSAPFNSLRNTHTVYSSTLTYADFFDFVYGPADVRSPEDFKKHLHRTREISPNIEREYYTALLAEDFVRAEQALRSIEESYLTHSSANIPQLKELVCRYLKSAEEFSVSNSQAPESITALHWKEEILSCRDLPELHNQISAFFSFFVNRSALRQKEHLGTAQRIVCYIDEYYTDANLSVAKLSEALSLSPSYISRSFKQQTGQNIPDYIHLKRVQKAKELLLSTQMSVSEIAEAVGYSTTWTLNRVFKQFVMMTPGAFRQTAAQGDPS